MLFALVFVVVGVAMWVAAWRLFSNGRRQMRKTALMRDVQTSRIADVAGLPVGAPVEVKGLVRCEEPLNGEMSGQECAYYLSQVLREYEVTFRDSDGDSHRNRRSEVLASHERFAPFSVEDDSGTVGIRFKGAEVDPLEVVNRFENETGGEGTFQLGGLTVHLGSGPRTLGYRYVESILPLDAPVYVLGTTGEDGRIGAAAEVEESKRFLISHRSEEQLGKRYDNSAILLILLAVGLFLFGSPFVFGGLLVTILSVFASTASVEPSVALGLAGHALSLLS